MKKNLPKTSPKPVAAPKRFAPGGRGERIGCSAVRTEFGWISIGATTRGLCWLALAGSKQKAEETLRQEFPLAEVYPDASLAAAAEAAVAAIRGKPDKKTIPLDLRGTDFQLKVWEALRTIPRGALVTYGELARQLGMSTAARAVAHACAANRVSLLMPCHRVVGAGGALTGYRWGLERKRKLLAAEQN